MARFLATADIHANKARLPKVLQFFDKCKTIIKDQKIDYFVIAGDLWNSMITNTSNSGFVDVLEALRDISQLTHIIAIYGTSTHDLSSSLECLKPMGIEVFDKNTLIERDGIKILLVPEPRASNYVRPTVQETTQAMIEDFDTAFNNKADLIFFHGETSNCTLDTGVKGKADCQLSQEQFNRTGAQLLLCGHIHTPSNPFKNAYYIGSPIPTAISQTHTPSVITFGFNNGKVVDFKRIELGLASNRPMDIDNLDLFRKLDKFNFKGNNVQIRLTLTPAQAEVFNIREEAKKLKEATGAEELQLRVFSSKEVSVRTNEISKVTSLQEKLDIYAKVNEIALSSSILAKAKELEDNLLIKYQFPTHSFELLSISLRGAKGIKGKDEVNFDFTKYQDGVIALTASNGSGKSTLLENCHPYPCLLTRSGSLRSHFFLKDSHRIVVFKDENDKYYRFTIQLAAHVDNGLVKYFVETSDDKGKTWVSVPGVDGSLDAYKNYVYGEFGSLEIYLRTAFFTKGKVKGINDIATATKSERITLISQLIGSDNLSALHDMVKDKLKDISKDMESLENIESRFDEVEKSISKKYNNEKALQSQLKDIEEELSEIESDIAETKVKQDEYNKNSAKYENAIQLKSETEDRIAEITDHLDKLKEHKVKNDYYINHTKQIEDFKKVYAELKPLQEEYDKVNKKYREYSDKLLEATTVYNEAKFRRDIEQNKYDKTDDRIQSAENNIINIEDFCPTCGAKLSATKKKQLLKAQSYQQAEIESLKQFKETQKTILEDAKKAYSSAKSEFDKATKNKKSYESKFNEIDGKLQSTKVYIDMNDLSDFLDYAPVTNLETDIKRFEDELNRKMEFLKTFEGVELVDYSDKLNSLEFNRKKDEELRLKLSVDIASVQTEIKQLEEQYTTMKEQVATMKVLSKDYEEYSILEQAFANSGIMALELEAAVPDIALLTNQILRESYGDKFSIAFNTLKESRKKIIDDFTIEVTNHETGWTTPLEMLSEGEKVWCVQALQFAFSLLRMERTGFSFKVRFVDESDGALDSESRSKYVNMINAAHHSGQARLTLMVTHSQEVKDIVSQTIQL